MNNILQCEEDPNIFVSIYYSEKSDTLMLELKYAGPHFDPRSCDSLLFKTILGEKTTTLLDETVEGKWYTNHTRLDFKWEDQ